MCRQTGESGSGGRDGGRVDGSRAVQCSLHLGLLFLSHNERWNLNKELEFWSKMKAPGIIILMGKAKALGRHSGFGHRVTDGARVVKVIWTNTNTESRARS